MESPYPLKFRLVKFLANKSQIFAFKPRSSLVTAFREMLSPLILESKKLICAFEVFCV